MNNQDQPPSRLRWHCRRGMQELDVMLGRWLEFAWPQADEARRRAFSELLECEDDQLWDWLSGRARPAPELQVIVREVREYTFGEHDQ